MARIIISDKFYDKPLPYRVGALKNRAAKH